MAKKKKTEVKKEQTKAPANPPTPPSQKEDLDKVIKEADAVILLTSRKGNIELRSLKNVNYAYEAKGLLLGAIHSYLVKPISETLRNINQGHVNMHHNTIQEIKKLINAKEEAAKEASDEK